VTRALQLDTLEAIRLFVHLKEGHDRNAAQSLSLQDDIDIAVTEVETFGEPHRGAAKMAQQVLRAFAPMDLRKQIRDFAFCPTGVPRHCAEKKANEKGGD
jgi:hypothetical protein